MAGSQIQVEMRYVAGIQLQVSREEPRITGRQLPIRKMAYDSQFAPGSKNLQDRASVPSRDEYLTGSQGR
jgi:hypothetical protein